MTTHIEAEQYKLSQPPKDLISSLNFQPNSNETLAVSSWDCHLYIYNANENALKQSIDLHAPILHACYTDCAHIAAGSMTGSLFLADTMHNSAVSSIGEHKSPVSFVHHWASGAGGGGDVSSASKLILSAGWDGWVHAWDPRAPPAVSGSSPGGGGGGACISMKQPAAVYTMDSGGCGSAGDASNLLVVGTSNRHVIIWDLRKPNNPFQSRESSLKYQTRAIRCFPNGQGFAMSSIEGRVAVEFFSSDPAVQRTKYSFKCHRDDTNVYSVNCLSFHRKYNTFASGGSDGVVNIWDGFNRKRVMQIPKLAEVGVSALNFSGDGSVLGIACSYNFEKGPLANHAEPSIFVRNVPDHEVKLKPPGGAKNKE